MSSGECQICMVMFLKLTTLCFVLHPPLSGCLLFSSTAFCSNSVRNETVIGCCCDGLQTDSVLTKSIKFNMLR